MKDFQDLQARAGQVEQAICELDDEHRDLLSSLQNGLNIAREKLIEKKLEIDRLNGENDKLRRLMERLLEYVESKPKKVLHDKLKDLDVQLNVLLRMSEDETAPGISEDETAPGISEDETAPGISEDETAPGQVEPGHVADYSAMASQSDGAEGGGDEPADIVSPAPDDSLLDEPRSDEPGSLHDIKTRVHDLSCKLTASELTKSVEKTTSLFREPEPHRLEPELIVQEQPDEPYSGSTSEDKVVRAPVEETRGFRHADHRADHRDERKAFGRLIESSTYTVRRAPPKTHMRFDAEVEYALGVLHQMIRGDRFFSVEQVRGLINGKFDLDLTAQHDRQLAANLSKRDNVTSTERRGATWKFGSAA